MGLININEIALPLPLQRAVELLGQAAVPGVLATEFGSDAEFTTAVILVSTLASIITLSVLLTPQ